VPWEDAVDEACSVLIWPLKQNSEDGEFIQWKWVVGVLWHTLQPSSSETSYSMARVASHSKELI